MKMDMAIAEKITFPGYDDRIHIDVDALVVAIWNEYADEGGDKIYLNDEQFFTQHFKTGFEAAWAVSTGNYRWTDDFVFISRGQLISFSHLTDETCPIQLDKIDLNRLQQQLQELVNLVKQEQGDKKGYVNNISPVIHEALQE